MKDSIAECRIDGFGRTICNALVEQKDVTDVDMPIIAKAALGAAVASAQDAVDMQRFGPNQPGEPISVYEMIVAPSGTAKSFGSNPHFAAAREFEAAATLMRHEALAEHAADRTVWNAKKKYLESRLNAAIAQEEEPDSDYEGPLSDELHERLKELHAERPEPGLLPKVYFDDASPASLIRNMALRWPSAALFSMEAGARLERILGKSFDFANTVYGGDPLDLDRVGLQASLPDPRFTMVLGIQYEPTVDYLFRHGILANSSGALPRFNWAVLPRNWRPRAMVEAGVAMPAMKILHERKLQLYWESYHRRISGKERHQVVFSKAAHDASKEFWDHMQSLTAPWQPFENFASHAARAVEKAGRVAVAAHKVDDREGDLDGYEYCKAAYYIKDSIVQFVDLLNSLSPAAVAEKDSVIVQGAIERAIRLGCASITFPSLKSLCSKPLSKPKFDAALTYLLDRGMARLMGGGSRLDLRPGGPWRYGMPSLSGEASFGFTLQAPAAIGSSPLHGTIFR